MQPDRTSAIMEQQPPTALPADEPVEVEPGKESKIEPSAVEAEIRETRSKLRDLQQTRDQCAQHLKRLEGRVRYLASKLEILARLQRIEGDSEEGSEEEIPL